MPKDRTIQPNHLIRNFVVVNFIVLIILITTAVMLLHSVPFLTVEDFAIYKLIAELKLGEFEWGKWLEFQANHLVLLNRLLYLINFYLGNKIILLNVLSCAFSLGSLYVFGKIIKTKEQIFTYFIASLFFFNWTLYETLTHAHTMNFNQEIFLSFLFMYGLKEKRYWFAGISLFFSFFTMLSWVSVIPVLIWKALQDKKKEYIPLILIALFGLFLYRHGVSSDPFHAKAYLNPLVFIPFDVAILGNLTGVSYLPLQFSLGGIVLILSFFAFKQTPYFWIKVMILWSLLHILLIGFGRAGTGLDYTIRSRYYSYLAPLYATLACHYYDKLSYKKILLSLLGFYFLLTSFYSYKRMRSSYLKQNESFVCVKKIIKMNRPISEQCSIDSVLLSGDHSTMLYLYHYMKKANIELPGLEL